MKDAFRNEANIFLRYDFVLGATKVRHYKLHAVCPDDTVRDPGPGSTHQEYIVKYQQCPPEIREPLKLSNEDFQLILVGR